MMRVITPLVAGGIFGAGLLQLLLQSAPRHPESGNDANDHRRESRSD